MLFGTKVPNSNDINTHPVNTIVLTCIEANRLRQQLPTSPGHYTLNSLSPPLRIIVRPNTPNSLSPANSPIDPK